MKHAKTCTDGGLSAFMKTYDSVLTTDTKDDGRNFHCIVCGDGFPFKRGVLEHMKIDHHPGQWKQFGFEQLISHLPDTDTGLTIPCKQENAKPLQKEMVSMNKFGEHAEGCTAECGDLWVRTAALLNVTKPYLCEKGKPWQMAEKELDENESE